MTRLHRTSITPATLPRTTSAWVGPNSAPCGIKTSRNSPRRRSPRPNAFSPSTACKLLTSPARSSKPIGPGAPSSSYSSKADLHGAAESTFKQQDELLERSIALAKQFNTGKVRCFDFWRLDDVAHYRAAIDEKLRATAEIAGKQGILLLLENEFACNTATGREAARTMNAIPTRIWPSTGTRPMPSCAANWTPSRQPGS